MTALDSCFRRNDEREGGNDEERAGMTEGGWRGNDEREGGNDRGGMARE